MVYLDRPKKAIPDLLLALAGAKELGIDSATTLAALARAYATLERWEEVERCIQEVEEAIQESELEGQVFLCGARARLLVAAGEMTAAYDTARQAVEITRGTDYAETSGMALIDFGWTALKTGNVTEARSATATAIDLCRKRGSVAMLERAEAILNEIESATV
jgi:tetratricopeptide (TPR) repeat protein